jgi:hypothetical protein
MFTWIRKRITYANVAMTLALLFAMSGGAYAAKKYLITSTKQISPKVIAALKGKAGANGPEGKQGPVGPAGPKGENGPAGAKGESGKEGKEGKGGTTGATGPEGATGPTGASGPTGPQGPLQPGKTESGVWTGTDQHLQLQSTAS